MGWNQYNTILETWINTNERRNCYLITCLSVVTFIVSQMALWGPPWCRCGPSDQGCQTPNMELNKPLRNVATRGQHTTTKSALHNPDLKYISSRCLEFINSFYFILFCLYIRFRLRSEPPKRASTSSRTTFARKWTCWGPVAATSCLTS